MSQLADGSIHKFLTGETVTGDDTQVSTNLNIALNLLRLAGNDTDTKVNNTYTKAQTDSALGVRDSAIAQLGIGQIPPVPGGAPIPVSLVNGLQVYNNLQASPLDNLKIPGFTLTNLLGRDGNCEDTSKWATSVITSSLDSTNKVYGTNGLKLVTSATNAEHYAQQSYNVKPNSYYIAVADAKPIVGQAILRLVGTSTPFANTAQTDTTKFSPIYLRYATTTDTSLIVRLQVLNASGATSYLGATENAVFDGVRLYEIPLADYNAIAGMTAAQIAAKYPYVDDVKHVNAPYVIKYGENLLPTFNEWTTINANTSIIEPYKISTTANGTDLNNVATIPVIVGQQYTLSVSKVGGKIGVDFVKQDGTSFNSTGFLDVSSLTITVPIDAVSARIFLTTASQASGTVTFSNPMLNLGATAKPFKPRNDDSLFFPNIQLASSVDGTVYDQLFKRDGKFWRENRFARDMVLDGSLAWVYNNDYTGFKRVLVPLSGSVSVVNGGNHFSAKYDGKILSNSNAVPTSADVYNYDGTQILVTIADTDSGWGETYTPTAGEIQAYFYGWTMADTSGSLYASGTKRWYAKWSTGAVWNNATENTYNTGTAPTKQAPSGYSPYKLTYQLATSTLEEIQVDAGMSLHEGLNQIEVGQAVQVREKANPYLYNGKYFINRNDLNGGSGNLKNRTSRIFGVYKNGKLDSNWIQYINASTSNGTVHVGEDSSNFDPTATYEVSYIALDQYLLSSSVQTVTGETAANLKTAVDLLVRDGADQEARINALEINKARKVQGQWIAPTLLNAWVWFGSVYNQAGYFKDEFSVVTLRGLIKNGTATSGTVLFTLPVGYRPIGKMILATYSNGLLGGVIINTDGTVVIDSGSNVYFSLENIKFLAEQ